MGAGDELEGQDDLITGVGRGRVVIAGQVRRRDWHVSHSPTQPVRHRRDAGLAGPVDDVDDRAPLTRRYASVYLCNQAAVARNLGVELLVWEQCEQLDASEVLGGPVEPKVGAVIVFLVPRLATPAQQMIQVLLIKSLENTNLVITA
ncbi:MAG: hypothetical protein ACRDT4_07880 [Micromonosporaceae bacterium]